MIGGYQLSVGFLRFFSSICEAVFQLNEITDNPLRVVTFFKNVAHLGIFARHVLNIEREVANNSGAGVDEGCFFGLVYGPKRLRTACLQRS